MEDFWEPPTALLVRLLRPEDAGGLRRLSLFSPGPRDPFPGCTADSAGEFETFSGAPSSVGRGVCVEFLVWAAQRERKSFG